MTQLFLKAFYCCLLLMYVACQQSPQDTMSTPYKTLRQHKKIQGIRIHLVTVDEEAEGQTQSIQGDGFRNLQSTEPHGFRIRAEYETLTYLRDDINLPLTKKIFNIASSYFQKVIKVTDIHPDNFLLPKSGCDIYNQPIIYTESGFSQKYMDSLLFIRALDNIEFPGVIAAAQICILARWPTYGVLEVGSQFFAKKPLKNSDYTTSFHQNLDAVIHQMFHFLGFNAQSMYNGLYYKKYLSNKFLKRSQILAPNPKIPLIDMVITPSVQRYVKDYFNCSDSRAGASMQQQYETATSDAQSQHWHPRIFYNDIVTPRLWQTGALITGLTLNLLNDTGYYYFVDTIGYVDKPTFGKRQGCNFLFGLNHHNFDQTKTPSNDSAQYCSDTTNISDFKCSFYGTHSGPCYYTDHIQTSYIYPFILCNQPGPSTADSVFSAQSRCFKVSDSTDNQSLSFSTSCILAQCKDSGQVVLTINGQSYTCALNQQNVTIDSLKVVYECPQSRQNFCAIKSCPSDCSQQGICINGECIRPSCTTIIPNCTDCQTVNSYLYSCNTCIPGLFLNNNKSECQTCQEVIPYCLQCATGSNARCLLCSGYTRLSQNGTVCIEPNCQSIPNCVKCETNLQGFPQCKKCKAPMILSQNSYSCQSCADRIPLCQKCTHNQKKHAICTICLGGTFIDNLPYVGSSCKPCSIIIPNCISCSNPSDTLPFTVCQKCKPQYLLVQLSAIQQRVCKKCNEVCKTCKYNTFTCTSCHGGYVLIGYQCKKTQKLFASGSYGGSCASGENMSNQVSCGVGCRFCTCQYINSIISTICILPQDTYVLSSQNINGVTKNTPLKCTQQGCKVCLLTNTSACSACQDHYSLQQSTSKCILCSQNCAQCKGYDPNYCTSCALGSYIDVFSNKCQACSKQKCLVCSDNKCSGCQDGYFWDSDNSVCSQCVAGCASCNVDNIAMCLSCNAGYYLTSKNKCMNCQKGCQDCEESSTMNFQPICRVCFDGYTLQTQNNICKPDCNYPCLECAGQLCQKCISGFSLNAVDKKCQLIAGPQCKTQSCQDCPPGSLRNNGFCKLCSILNCIHCIMIKQQSCSKCINGYYPSSDTMSCLNCPLQCTECTNVNYCTACTEGYTQLLENQQENMVEVEGKCWPCSQNCKTCINHPQTCTSCHSEYTLLGFHCSISAVVTFTIILNQNFQIFMTEKKYNNVTSKILQPLGPQFATHSQLLTFISIQQGSTIIRGQVQHFSNTSTPTSICQQVSAMASILKAGKFVSDGEMQILLTEVNASNQNCGSMQPNPQGNNPTSEEFWKNNNSQGWMIASLVLLPILAVTIVVVVVVGVIYFRGLKRSNKISDTNSQQESKEDMHDQNGKKVDDLKEEIGNSQGNTN